MSLNAFLRKDIDVQHRLGPMKSHRRQHFLSSDIGHHRTIQCCACKSFTHKVLRRNGHRNHRS